MNIKIIAFILGALVASFAIGRYSAPEKVKTEIKIEKVIEKQEVVRTVTRVIEHPDGSKETEVTEDKETNTHSDTTKEKNKEIIVAHNYLNVSLLAGGQPHLFQGVSLGPIVYGASVTKSLIGPITVGAWALSDYSVGLSLGLNF